MRSEKDLHIAFSAWLRKHSIPFFHSRMDAKTSQTCGDPDYICVFNGNCALVEFKWLKGKLSPAQKQRIEELETAGNAVCIAYDLQTAISHVESVFGSNTVLGHPGASDDRLWHLLKEIEMHCPCGARPESPNTHPHVGGCPVDAAIRLFDGADAHAKARARAQALSEGGDATCPQESNGGQIEGLTQQPRTSNGAGQSNPEPAPKLWLAKSRDLGDVVVQRNPEGHMGFVRLAKAEDFTLPRWTEALG